MGFINYVKRLRCNNAPRPFSSKVCNTIYDIISSSDVDLYSTILEETKIQKSNEIDILL